MAYVKKLTVTPHKVTYIDFIKKYWTGEAYMDCPYCKERVLINKKVHKMSEEVKCLWCGELVRVRYRLNHE